MWVGDGQSTPFVWHFGSMTDGDYFHAVFHSSPLVFTCPTEKDKNVLS